MLAGYNAVNVHVDKKTNVCCIHSHKLYKYTASVIRMFQLSEHPSNTQRGVRISEDAQYTSDTVIPTSWCGAYTYPQTLTVCIFAHRLSSSFRRL